MSEGNPFKPVSPGDPLGVHAVTYNLMLEMLDAYRQGRLGGPRRSPGRTHRQTGIVPIKNASGTARRRFDVLGIASPLADPSLDPDTFCERVVLTGVSPTADHAGRFAILLNAADQDGEIVRAVVSGVTIARVDMADADHRFADVKADDATQLASGCRGAAQILWAQPGTGTKWAIIRIAGLQSAVCWGKAIADWTNLAGNGSYVTVHPCADRDGTGENTDITLTVYLPRNGTRLDPNVRGDDVIAYERTSDGTWVAVGGYLDQTIGTVATTNSATDARIGNGWQLADGTNGTMDLRERVPAGYLADDPEYGSEGDTSIGADTHLHPGPMHQHVMDHPQPAGGDIAAGCGYNKTFAGSTAGAGNGNTGPADGRDAQTVVVFIQRVD